jgi:hypothetical protein
VSSRSTAGQASLEYVAALALLAAVFVVAAPAVGAPDIPRLVVGKLRLAVCFVANDVCSSKAARDAGLAPCPLTSDTSGHEVSVTAFSIEVGHGWTLTVTPQSDGSVSIVRTASGTAGLVAGTPGAGGGIGPIALDPGASIGARARVQAARGWVFGDQATAARFLEHAVVNSLNEWGDFPADWTSVENGRDMMGSIGEAIGGKAALDRLQLFGITASAEGALGARIASGAVTLYGRLALDGDVSVPFFGSVAGNGREEWLAEYTFGRDGPRELAFRRLDATAHGDRSVDTLMRLDLRDPANRAVAQPLLDTRLPWPPSIRPRVDAVLRRIGTHGTVERTVFEVADDSIGASGSVRGPWKFGASGKLIRVHKRLVEATARTGGAERERFDCVA